MDTKLNLKILKRIIKTPSEDMLKFYTDMGAPTTHFLGHLVHSLKKYTPPELKDHVKSILRCPDPKSAGLAFQKAHIETGAGFSDWLKKGANAVSNGVKAIGAKAVEAKNAFFDKAVPLAEKGLAYAKPFIKEQGPTLLGKAAEMIPVVGPIAGPIVKKGAEWLLNKWV
jgi:hypothetical protein